MYKNKITLVLIYELCKHIYDLLLSQIELQIYFYWSAARVEATHKKLTSPRWLK